MLSPAFLGRGILHGSLNTPTAYCGGEAELWGRPNSRAMSETVQLCIAALLFWVSAGPRQLLGGLVGKCTIGRSRLKAISG